MARAMAGESQAPGAPLEDYFARLLERFGPQGWWPARTRMEVILGAILTQNTAWNNASLALSELRSRGLLRIGTLRHVPQQTLESAIRHAGFFRQKAAAIRAFIRWLDSDYGGSLARLFAAPPERLRSELLGVKGLGPETADVILLYAGHKPWFVADAYTRRILSRHGWLAAGAAYHEAQALLHRALPRDYALFSEFHALLVETGKKFCKRREAQCAGCPLREYLPSPEFAHDELAYPPRRIAAG